MWGRSTCPWGPTFFGLGPNDQDIFLEPAFLLVYHGGFSLSEALSMPVTWRRWFIQRINAEKQAEAKSGENSNEDTGQSRAVDIQKLVQLAENRRRNF